MANRKGVSISWKEYSELQKLQRNFQNKKRKMVLANKRPKEKDHESDNRKIIALVFRISDNRRRDLDGMASTVLDCLTRSGKIKDDARQYIPGHIVRYEIVEPGKEGVDVYIIKRINLL